MPHSYLKFISIPDWRGIMKKLLLVLALLLVCSTAYAKPGAEKTAARIAELENQVTELLARLGMPRQTL